MEYEVVCEFCHGEMFHLGKLGKSEWFRCRQCGLERTLGAGELERFNAFLEVAREAEVERLCESE